MSDPVVVVPGSEAAPAESAETTALGVQVGEANVRTQQAVEAAETASQQAAAAVEAATTAAAAAQSASEQRTEQYVTHEQLRAHGDELLTRIAEVVKPQEPPPPPPQEPKEPDTAPKSREKVAKRKSFADRFYNRQSKED